jgi:phosphomannomutase
MSSSLMKSVSGIRGVVGETVTPELIIAVGSAFASYCNFGTVVIGRDTRPTGEAIQKGLESSLVMSGCDVVNIGIVPTPTVQLMVEHLKAEGGIVISASHNPIEWNAFKLIGSRGTFLTSSEIGKFFNIMEKKFTYQKWDGVGTITNKTGAEEIHIKKVCSVIDIDSVRKKRYRVAIDSVNGAGSIITQKLLSELGCEVIPVNCEMTGIFPRGPEPVAKNLSILATTVLRQKADVGFAQDPDADRLAVVSDKGIPIGEEYTIVLVAEHLLSRRAGRVVINLSTTKAVDDIAQSHGAPVARTRVGEINVVEEMMRHGALIGGEGNGGVISPEVHLGRDSLVGIAYVLEMMAARNKSVSQLVSELPAYSMIKDSISLSGTGIDNSILPRIKQDFTGQKISSVDGLRIEFIDHPLFKGGWVHLRPSNTEPIFRIIAEGQDEKQARSIIDYFKTMIK